MKHIKQFEGFEDKIFESMQDSLKQRLIEYYMEHESDYDPEETENVIEIVNQYDDNLSGLGGWDKTLLLRLIDDSEIYQEVDNIGKGEDDKVDNLFDRYKYRR